MSTEPVDIGLDDAIQIFEGSQGSFTESLSYYESEKRNNAIGIATPPKMRPLLAHVGIPRVYINSITDRLAVEGFRMGGEGRHDDELWSWWQVNTLDVESALAHTDALVYGRSYVTIAAPDTDDPALVDPSIPIIRVESPTALYAHIDPRTRRVQWAVRVIKDETGDMIGATLYLPDRTEFYTSNQGEFVSNGTVNHGLGIVPVVPIVNRSRLADLNGTSAITPELRSVTDAISSMLMNLRTTSELMAVPQRVVFGAREEELTQDGELSALETYISSYLTIEDPEGKVQQLQAAELRNFADGIGQLLNMAATYTGLPPQYLTQADSNPSSAEAIRSSESRLVRTCETKTDIFGEAWEQVMRVAMAVMGREVTTDAYRMETIWRDPGTPTFQAKADAVMKLYAGGTGIIPVEQARIDMGYSPEAREQMEQWDKQSPMSQAMAMYGGGTQLPDTDPVTGEPPVDADDAS